MKKLLLLLLSILVACSPAMPPAEPVEPVTVPEAKIVAEEEVTTPAEAPEEQPVVEEEVVPGTPLEPKGYDIEPYTQLGCEQLLTEGEFASNCEKESDILVVTYKIGTNNCFVSIKDRLNERLTAGITLTGYKDAESAEEEFDRRLKVLKVGADDSVGERAYTPPIAMVDREEMEFLRDKFIVEGGSDTRLCSKEGVLAIMRIVDSRIK